MPYFEEAGEEIGFHRRGRGRGRPQREDPEDCGSDIEIDVPTGNEELLGSFTGDDGVEYDEIGVEYDVIGIEIDPTGARPVRKRRLGRKLKKVIRQRERNYRQDQRLLGKQRGYETELHRKHTDVGYDAAGRKCPPSGAANMAVAKPLVTSTSLAAAASGTNTLTPQYPVTTEKIVMTASLGALAAVLITSILFGVDTLFGNPEFTAGFGADALAQNNTLGDFIRGRRITPQQPLKVTFTNNHVATQSISTFVKTDTTLGAYAEVAT